MNDFHMMNLANDIVAQRRAEADRSRLARTAHADLAPERRSARTPQSRRSSASLSALFHRVALF